jgi:putative ABC transport system permease protein
MRIAMVTPGYFRALGLKLDRGRLFTEEDREGAMRVVILTRAAARRFFPNEDPIGRKITLGWGTEEGYWGGRVVGIVGDYKQSTLANDPDPQLLLPYDQLPLGSLSVVVRSKGDLGAVAAAARAQIREVDPDLPLYGLQTLEDLVSSSVAQPRFYMLLLGGFAAVALLMAAIGIYGVITYAVSQRRQEIGVRMALGATRKGVAGMVLRQGLLLAAAGAAAGLAGAFMATRGLRSLLYQVSASDPMTYAAVALVLVLVSALASYLPARRAAHTDPQLALRAEA